MERRNELCRGQTLRNNDFFDLLDSSVHFDTSAIFCVFYCEKNMEFIIQMLPQQQQRQQDVVTRIKCLTVPGVSADVGTLDAQAQPLLHHKRSRFGQVNELRHRTTTALLGWDAFLRCSRTCSCDNNATPNKKGDQGANVESSEPERRGGRDLSNTNAENET
ncbi:hypothetical protein FOCC_FOCC016065 [Frankliniella occidentalis]|nr:hypothetical protein FOCC_FOCC016065 [Frankliniella occidentalis]